MQLASRGGERAGALWQTSKVLGQSARVPQYLRSIHTRPPSVPTAGRVQRVLFQTRTVLSRFVSHLTAPGIGHVPSTTRTLYDGLPGRIPSIRDRLSKGARAQLSRPMQAHYFPKVSAVPRYSVANVGLGTARNFSTTRQVFQNIVDNVPITARAVLEADLDVKAQEKKIKRSMLKDEHTTPKGKMMMKAKEQRKVIPSKKVDKEEQVQDAFEYYFSPAPETKPIASYLLIPLAPTPSSRVPLPPDTSGSPSLLYLPELAYLHNSHELHSLRVSALFSRLDAANVWERGVKCSAYAHSSTLEGTCTILKIEFEGWSQADVRSVIGESGSGWCALEEVQTAAAHESEEESLYDSDSLSETSSIASGIFEDGFSEILEPPIHSDVMTDTFVMPRLAFSSASSLVQPTPPLLSRSSTLSDFDDSVSSSFSDFSEVRSPSDTSQAFSLVGSG